jgi:hypothetical protein
MIMKSLFESILDFFTPGQDRDERYLADSVDVYDLERRMRQLDAGRESFYTQGSHGL